MAASSPQQQRHRSSRRIPWPLLLLLCAFLASIVIIWRSPALLVEDASIHLAASHRTAADIPLMNLQQQQQQKFTALHNQLRQQERDIASLRKELKDLRYEQKQQQAQSSQQTSVAQRKTSAATNDKNKKKSNPQTVWHNDRNVVHVLLTRFMQHQPNLVTLGEARLELFRTFCYTTIKQQTSQQFLWLIRADPDLHPVLKKGLLSIIKGMPNVLVIGSNEIRKGSVDGGFRAAHAISDVNASNIMYGSYDLLKSYHEAAQTRVLLETGVDADDGLGLTFMETTEQQALELFEKTRAKQNGWLNLCVNQHMEWHYFAPWDNSTVRGSLMRGSTHICVTPGLTWASQPKATAEFQRMHHIIKRTTKECSESDRDDYGCWIHITSDKHLAIRARTPTSTGMNRVRLGNERVHKQQITLDTELWSKIETEMGIPEDAVIATRKELARNLTAIVLENLEGQCRKDHSCHEGINNKLRTTVGIPTVELDEKGKPKKKT